MELEQMPQPGPGMCGSDREVFERVWRRVMETGGGESPVEVVPAEEAALPAPAQPLPAPAVPAPAAVDPEDALCCLGPASAAYGGALQRFIEGELQDAVTYAALARRGRHRAAARFAALAHTLPTLQKAELLPFHKLCLHKYENLGLPFPLADVPAASAEHLTHLRAALGDLAG